MAATVNIISRCGFRIEVHHRNQPNNSKQSMNKLFLSLPSVILKNYISNKGKCFNCKSGCGMMHIKAPLKEELAWTIDKRLGLLVIRTYCSLQIYAQ